MLFLWFYFSLLGLTWTRARVTIRVMPDAPVGEKIRRARERRRWTQKRLADEIGGVSFKTVGNWERGLSYPRNAIGRIEEVLAISLTEDAGAPAPPADPTERELWDLARVDAGPEGAWAVVEEYRRRRRRTA